jgi:predicted esterase
MKQILFTVFVFLSVFGVDAQPFRYLNTIFQKSDTLKEIEYARAEWLNRPIAMLASYNIHEGENTTINRPLFMDISVPHGDTLKNRPAIIFAHSGGFLLGSRYNDDMTALCDSFARRGFVTATIDYRIGMGATVTRFLGIIIGLKVTETNGYRSFYRGIQDSRAAIRFLKQNAGVYGIDTTKVYFVGSSAGAILSLHNVYLDQPDEILPDAFSTPSLGSLDSIGVQGFGAKASATVGMWGSLQAPELIENEDTPIFLIHGTDDDIVPFKKGILLEGIVPSNPAVSVTLPESYGSFCIDTALNNRSISHETYFVPGKKHEFYGVDTGEFPPEGPNEYWDTIQWKIGDFVFERFRPDAGFNVEIQNLTAHFSCTSSEINLAKWDFGDGTTGNGNQVSHTYTVDGIYNVQLTVFNNNLACDTLTKQVTAETDVLVENNAMNEISIYPNPVSGSINFAGISKTFDVLVYNLHGQLLFSQKNVSENNINVKFLNQGTYIIEINFDEGKIRRKFFKTD